MFVQAAALGMVAFGNDFGIWLAAVILLGAGTAMVYPTLLAAIGDVAHPGGGHVQSASTGYGAMADSPSAPCSRDSSPTPTASRQPY